MLGNGGENSAYDPKNDLINLTVWNFIKDFQYYDQSLWVLTKL